MTAGREEVDHERLVAALRKSVRDNRRLARRYTELRDRLDEPVAVVSMACRLPGGVRTPEDLWELVDTGKSAVGPLPEDRGWDLDTPHGSRTGPAGGLRTRRGGFLADAADFDAAFFGITPREAVAMDPQQRLLLTTAWEAVERAGVVPGTLPGRPVGVFTGVLASDYHPGFGRVPDGYEGYVLTGTGTSLVSGRIAYLLGLHGPAITVDTACSSSLVAVHLAVQSLRSGECELALAGGATVMATPQTLVEFAVQGALAADGRCKAFGADADGTVLGEGAGMLLLARLSTAERLGLPVLAVVRGSAVNSDGASNGLTAPNGSSQRALIRTALSRAGLTGADVDLVEAHGTGTALGDPVEADALIDTYGQDRADDQPLWIGSVKGNVGHTQAAAGVTGVIKAVTAMVAGRMPRSLHAEEPTAAVRWSRGAVRVLAEARAWPRPGRPRRAAVSAFGLSGTNAHVILEEPPATGPAAAGGVSAGSGAGRPLVFPLSTRTAEALPEQAASLLAHLTDRPDLPPAAVARTLAVGRTRFPHRAAVVAATRDDLLEGLARLADGEPGSPGSEAGGSPDLAEARELAARFRAGADVDWSALFGSAPPRTVPLPTHPLRPRRHWWPLTAAPAPRSRTSSAGAVTPADDMAVGPVAAAVTVLGAVPGGMAPGDGAGAGYGVAPEVAVEGQAVREGAAAAGGEVPVQGPATVRGVGADSGVVAKDVSVSGPGSGAETGTPVAAESVRTAGDGAGAGYGVAPEVAVEGQAVREGAAAAGGEVPVQGPATVRGVGADSGVVAKDVSVSGPGSGAETGTLVAAESVRTAGDGAVTGTGGAAMDAGAVQGVRMPAQVATATTGHGPAVTPQGCEPERLDVLVKSSVAAVAGHEDWRLVDADTAFRDLGLTSLGLTELHERLREATGLPLPTGLLFAHPTPRALAAQLGGMLARPTPAPAGHPGPAPAPRPVLDDARSAPDHDAIAIVGMGCRYPGGVTGPEELWRVVAGERDATTGFPEDRGWAVSGLPDGAARGGFLDDVTAFDPSFFRISPQHATAMDPQHRLLLEISWEALERAGIDPLTLRGSRTGVFVGIALQDYRPRDPGTAGHRALGTAPSVASGRIAYHLGLHGPAVTVDTACSSSLVALHLACQSLRSGESALALAGGATVLATPEAFTEFHALGGLASDGRCKAFGEQADGTGWAEGAGVLVLERLADARAAGHPVLAVVRGSAVNQDGAGNGLSAPNGTAQQAVIRDALAAAGVRAAQVDLIEAHGTGTRLGDPVEAEALLATYGTDRPSPAWLGSLKSNIGHTMAAAGVGGVIKTVMAMRHGSLPATLHAGRPTSRVDWNTGRLRLLTDARDWPVRDRRLAAVSAFGMSGTNAHVVLEEGRPAETAPAPSAFPAAPAPSAVPVPVGGVPSPGPSATVGAAGPAGAPGSAGPAGAASPDASVPAEPVAWPVSGHTDAALRANAGRLHAWLSERPGVTAAEVAHALARRSAFRHRAVVTAGTRAGLLDGLLAVTEGRRYAGAVEGVPRHDAVLLGVLSPGVADGGPRNWRAYGMVPERLLRLGRDGGAAARTAFTGPGHHVVVCFTDGDSSLSDLVREAAVEAGASAQVLSVPVSPDPATLADVLGRAWTLGLSVSWPAGEIPGPPVELPTYAFQRRRLWTAEQTTEPRAGGAPAEVPAGSAAGSGRVSPDRAVTGSGREAGSVPTAAAVEVAAVGSAVGEAAVGVVAAVGPAVGEVAVGEVAAVGSAVGEAAVGEVAALGSAVGEAAVVEPAAVGPAVDEAAVVEVAVEEPAVVEVVGTYDSVLSVVVSLTAGLLGVDEDAVDPGQGFFAQGMDSLTVTSLCELLADRLHLTVDPTACFDHPTPADLARHLTGPVPSPLAAPPAPATSMPPVEAVPQPAAPVGSTEPSAPVRAARLSVRPPAAIATTPTPAAGTTPPLPTTHTTPALSTTRTPASPSPTRARAATGRTAPPAATAPVTGPTAPRAARTGGSDAIAVVGMACRLPGADSPEALHRLAVEGGDALRELPDGRWDAERFHTAAPGAPGMITARRAGLLPDIDTFDAAFFGIAPREAAYMDPQQRMFLEVGWHALEAAGLAADRLAGTRTGVFLGITGADYTQSTFQHVPPESLDGYVLTGAASTFAAGRLSHRLGLNGPSLSVDTACSSSLTALHLACQSLRAGECGAALVGGVNALIAPEPFVVLSRAGMLSPDGRCKPFDAAANGYARAEGCVAVVLRPLADALADGDPVLAVIRGSAVRHDGSSSGVTVPNGGAQRAVVRQALADAGVRPADIGYVETHGTGTALGDPIELRALGEVLSEDRSAGSPAVIGAIKGNVGHLEAAAGLAGLVHAIETLRTGRIAPIAHLSTVNPAIGIDALPLVLPTAARPWPRGERPRLAGVSSFGASGTNVHVILEEAPRTAEREPELEPEPEQRSAPSAVRQPEPEPEPTSERPVRRERLIVLSARDEEALRALADAHRAAASAPLADLARSTATGRTHFRHRLAVRAATPEEYRARLAAHLDGRPATGVHTGRAPARPPRIGFVLTAQGAASPSAARALYGTDPAFRADLDRCDTLFAERLPHGPRLLDVLFARSGAMEPGAGETRARAVEFAVRYGLLRLWERWGVRPAAVLAGGTGSHAAAVAAGAVSLADALALIADPTAEATCAVPRLPLVCATSGEPVAEDGRAVRDMLDRAARPGGAPAAGARLLDALDCALYVHLGPEEPALAHASQAAPRRHIVAPLPGAEDPTGLLAALAELYVTGAGIDWERVYEHASGARIPLPPYPFTRHRYWYPTHPRPSAQPPAPHTTPPAGPPSASEQTAPPAGPPSASEQTAPPAGPPSAPGPVARPAAPPVTPGSGDQPAGPPAPASGPAPTPVPAPPAGPPGERLLTTDSHTGLGDCVSGGTAVVNAGFHIEAAVRAGRELYGTTHVRLTGLTLPHAMLLPQDGGGVHTRVTLTQPTEGGAGFTHQGRVAPQEAWRTHARGTVLPGPVAPARLSAADLDAIRRRCASTLTGRAYYRALWRRGLHLGPSACWLTSVARRDGEALAVLRAADAEEEADGCALHPGVVDSALQLVFACESPGAPADRVYVLVSMEEYVFHGHDGGPLLCHFSVRPTARPGGTITADVQLLDDGRRVAELRGVRMLAASRDTLLRTLGTPHRPTVPGAHTDPVRRADPVPPADPAPHADSAPPDDLRPHADPRSDADLRSDAASRPDADLRPHGHRRADTDRRPDTNPRPNADSQPDIASQPASTLAPTTTPASGTPPTPNAGPRPDASPLSRAGTSAPRAEAEAVAPGAVGHGPAGAPRSRAGTADDVLALAARRTAQVLGAGADAVGDAWRVPAPVDVETPLTDLGMDSLLGIELRDLLCADLGVDAPVEWFLEQPTLTELAARLGGLPTAGDRAPDAPVPAVVERFAPGGLHVVERGTGDPVLLVHGGGFAGPESWRAQEPLAARHRLLVVSRPGYGRSEEHGPEDYVTDGRLLAGLLTRPTHVVAHSYGTLGAMLAAVRRPETVRSLTLVESAASAAARGSEAVDAYERAARGLVARPGADPDAFFRRLFALIDPTTRYPVPLPGELSRSARRLSADTRWPWEAVVPVRELRAAPFPVLVVSGGARPVFERISDALAEQLGARRLVVPGGHAVQNTGAPFNTALEEFWSTG
ncbi:alpha/beta fold hydrolase [Streptomyces sp. NPDC017673]|uniref:alpha/beta fold hydrolase n=1 Tax=unclassified Streptomyces TaxID=2593676 RepID=UPI00379DDDB2